MQAIFHDAIDLLRWRVRPLEHYRYPLSHILSVLILLGVTGASGAGEMGDNTAGKLVFFTLLGALETLLMAAFMRWWLKLTEQGLQLPLFGLLLAAGMAQVLQPLTSWMPDDVAQAATLAIALYGMVVMIHALSVVSGLSRVRVLAGTLLFSPLAALLMAISFSTGQQLGLIEVPADLQPTTSQSAPAETAN